MSFRSRWRIRGRLTAKSPLHVGSGIPTERKDCTNEVTGEPVQINDVARDARGLPYLPATALKGVLRRRLEAQGHSRTVLDSLLGHPVDEEDEKKQLGGLAEVWDAPLEERSTEAGAAVQEEESDEEHRPPHWDEERRTGVAARVSIDRRTGAAAHQRLFHLEYVPAGTSFEVTAAGALDEDQVVLLLGALAGFNDPDLPVTLGAETVDGWGRLNWETVELRRLDEAGTLRWLQAGAVEVAQDALDPLPDAERDALLDRAARLSPSPTAAPAVLGLDLVLEFDGPFLVNDPSQTGTGEDEPDHAPLLDPEGRPLLPASSFRGVLRSQAERVLRTVRGPEAACGPGLGGGVGRRPCLPPESVEDLGNLCPACRVFGAAGWRSPIHLSDFTARDGEEGEARRQEFLAIDRFTGGGAEDWLGLDKGYSGLKFNAEGFVGPTLRGRMEIDLTALARAGGTSWALALLALVLRDLVEGDLGFGWGAGKGYGRCTARIDGVRLPEWERVPEGIREEIAQLDLEGEDLLANPEQDLLDEESKLAFVLMSAVADLADVPIERAAEGSA